MKESTITGLFIIVEVVLGALLGQLYINQYSFWNSEQTFGQFFVTVMLIYVGTVFLLGTVNLRIIKRLKRRKLIRSIISAVILAIIFTIPILVLPYAAVDNFGTHDISLFVMILIGLVIGFNLQVLRKAED